MTTPSGLLMSPVIVRGQSVPLSATTAIVVWQQVTGAFGYNIHVYRNGEQVGTVKSVSQKCVNWEEHGSSELENSMERRPGGPCANTGSNPWRGHGVKGVTPC